MLPSPLWKVCSTGHLFTDYSEWLDARDYDVDGAQAPTINSRRPRLAGEGIEHGTFFRSSGRPQLLQMGLGPAWNLSLAMCPGGIDVSPLDLDMLQDTDLTHAATYTATYCGSLAQRQSESIRPVRALSARLWPTSLHLQKAMRPQVYKISKDFHVPFHAIAIVLIFWPDCSPPDVARCGTFLLWPLGAHPSASTSRTARLLVPGEPPQRRRESDGIVGVESSDKPDVLLGGVLLSTPREARPATSRQRMSSTRSTEKGVGWPWSASKFHKAQAIRKPSMTARNSGARNSETLDICTAVQALET